MNIPLIAGRDFSPAFGRDSLNFILNEEAVKRMNLQNPVGQEITFWRAKGTVIGVVKNFHLQSLRSSIQPLILRLEPKPNWGYVLVKAQAGKTREALASFSKAHQKYNPVYPFTYHFADEAVQELYQSERMLGKLSNAFTGLAIFISCLGLFGLTAFSAGQRTKEIGIRKVLGASATHTTYLLSKDFLKLVLLAFVVATPLAWMGIHLWLQNYAYRIEIQPAMFVLAGISAVIISLLTISFLTIKAALANPVNSLRSE
jgi:ABC-type antimicrobial peptide transport system permease subunit